MKLLVYIFSGMGMILFSCIKTERKIRLEGKIIDESTLNKLADLTINIQKINKSASRDTIYLTWQSNNIDFSMRNIRYVYRGCIRSTVLPPIPPRGDS
jgi:hypothetical protein